MATDTTMNHKFLDVKTSNISICRYKSWFWKILHLP